MPEECYSEDDVQQDPLPIKCQICDDYFLCLSANCIKSMVIGSE